jgi:hypothetical protein
MSYKRTPKGDVQMAILVDENGDTQLTSNITTKFRDGFENYNPTVWRENRATGDIIQVDGNAGGASYLVISKDPLTAGVSTVETVNTFDMPFEMSLGLHFSQRTNGQEFSVEVVSDETPTAAPNDVSIVSISQAGAVLTVTTATPHGLRPGMRAGTRGCADSRLNYAGLVVLATPTPTQFTSNSAPWGALPSVTAGPFTSGFVFVRPAMGFAPNGTSMVFETAAAQAAFYIRNGGGDLLPSGVVLGQHSIVIDNPTSLQAINAAYAYAFQPRTEFRLSQFSDGLQWSDVPMDGLGASNNRYKRNQVIPDHTKQYKLRFRAANQPSMTRPVAQIVRVTKTGSTTATVETDVPHGLTTADSIQAWTRDITNFAPLAAVAVASIVNATTFTVVWGGAVTATSFGGIVARVNGGQALQGVLTGGANIQSVVRVGNIVTVTGNAAIAGALIGDYINIAGVRNAVDGASLGIDGAYRVRNISASTTELEPIGSTPTGADILSTNCGGLLIRRTCLRISFARLMDFERHRVELMPRPAGDMSGAVPAEVKNAPNTVPTSWFLRITDGSTGVVAAIKAASTAPVATDPALVVAMSPNSPGVSVEDVAAPASLSHMTMGGVVRAAFLPGTIVAGDAVRVTMTLAGAQTVAQGAPVVGAEVASAARTVSGNSGAISVPTGGAISAAIAITAASGINPTLDLFLAETFDNGTTWVRTYAFPRQTAAGGVLRLEAYKLAAGQRRWEWEIGGTSPSFTFGITTGQASGEAPFLRRVYDRTAALINGTSGGTSAWLNIAAMEAVTAYVTLGVTTTPATYQWRVGNDQTLTNGVLVGSPVAAVANGTVAIPLPAGIVAEWARLEVIGVGTGQTGVHVAMNARG